MEAERGPRSRAKEGLLGTCRPCITNPPISSSACHRPMLTFPPRLIGPSTPIPGFPPRHAPAELQPHRPGLPNPSRVPSVHPSRAMSGAVRFPCVGVRS